MAALLLSFAGAALGGSLLGPLGLVAGRVIGAVAGSVIDGALLGGKRHIDGPRLSDLEVMGSTEGAPIPRVYGRARIGGELIWATRLEEVVAKRNEGAKGGVGRRGISDDNVDSGFVRELFFGTCAYHVHDEKLVLAGSILISVGWAHV